MYETRNQFSFRLVLLGLISIFAISMSACSFMSKGSAEMMETEEMSEETNMMEMEETETTEMMAEEVAPLVVSDDIHFVAAGESLWSISGMTSIYNDSFRWPLIYKRNKDIEDADLIFPGQELAIPRDLTRAEIDAAISHARNRGAWSIGEIEEVDVQFRGNSM